MRKPILLLMTLVAAVASYAQDLTQVIDKVSPSIFLITTYDADGNEIVAAGNFIVDENFLPAFHQNEILFFGSGAFKIELLKNKFWKVFEMHL